MPLTRLRPRIHGLLVLEGVLVHCEAHAWCVAVRRPTGEVVVRRRSGTGRLPLYLRLWGLRELVLSLIELGRLAVGLWFSAQQAGLGRTLARAAKGTGDLPLPPSAEVRRQRLRTTAIAALLMVSTLLGLGLLLLGPAVICGFGPAQPLWGRNTPLPLAESLLGALLVPWFFGAMVRIGPLRRWANYHGALHRGLNAYEAGIPLELAASARCDFATGACGLTTLGLAAALLPYLARLAGLFWPQARAWLVVEEHHLGALMGAFGLRLGVGLIALSLARELRGTLAARLPLRALGRHWILPSVQDPCDEATEVVLAALRNVASGGEVGADARARPLSWSPLAADACTRSATHKPQAAAR